MLITLRLSASRTAWSEKITPKLVSSSCVSLLRARKEHLWPPASAFLPLCVLLIPFKLKVFFFPHCLRQVWPHAKAFWCWNINISRKGLSLRWWWWCVIIYTVRLPVVISSVSVLLISFVLKRGAFYYYWSTTGIHHHPVRDLEFKYKLQSTSAWDLTYLWAGNACFTAQLVQPPIFQPQLNTAASLCVTLTILLPEWRPSATGLTVQAAR